MKSRFYYIGGASASGKTTCMNRLVNEFDVTAIELDNIHNAIKPMLNGGSLEEATKNIAAFCMESLLKNGESIIVEGGWIEPLKAKEFVCSYGDRFVPVYCGYPKAIVEEHLKIVLAGKEHWLTKRDPETARAFINEQIEGSEWYEEQCATYGFKFFDFSNIAEGSDALHEHCREWLVGQDGIVTV